MLILTQRPGDEVVITVPPSAEPIEITVALLGVKGNQARNGYNAPRIVTIDRAEIHERKKAQKLSGNC